MRHVAVAGDTYTILVGGAETAGRYCMIDMHVPAGGGPPPHRHDFEEMFTLLEGELEFTFRGKTSNVRAGSTINIPANAPARLQKRIRCCRPDAVRGHARRPGRLLPRNWRSS
jgi:quercetin dioxygenase-like cupin family protein